jgi:hypothetical protein
VRDNYNIIEETFQTTCPDSFPLDGGLTFGEKNQPAGLLELSQNLPSVSDGLWFCSEDGASDTLNSVFERHRWHPVPTDTKCSVRFNHRRFESLFRESEPVNVRHISFLELPFHEFRLKPERLHRQKILTLSLGIERHSVPKGIVPVKN